jgi:hypothetical protein
MSGPNPKGRDQEADEIAAAELLFQDSEPPATRKRTEPIKAGDASSEFELADLPDSPVPPKEPSQASPATKSRAETEEKARHRGRMVAPETPAVEQTWSRGAEWGPTLLVLACWTALVLGLAYFTLGAELYGVTGMLLLGGALVGAVLSYPILITLERPVRITPEQAARDYFGALSHHVPHLRRMWLLLSTRGRTSPHYASFEGFKAYWLGRLDELRQRQAGRLSPLVFQVDEFEAEKSAGKSVIDARFKLCVLVRGRRTKGPIWSQTLKRGFVRGPDSMWYLEDGTLPDAQASP